MSMQTQPNWWALGAWNVVQFIPNAQALFRRLCHKTLLRIVGGFIILISGNA